MHSPLSTDTCSLAFFLASLAALPIPVDGSPPSTLWEDDDDDDLILLAIIHATHLGLGAEAASSTTREDSMAREARATRGNMASAVPNTHDTTGRGSPRSDLRRAMAGRRTHGSTTCSQTTREITKIRCFISDFIIAVDDVVEVSTLAALSVLNIFKLIKKNNQQTGNAWSETSSNTTATR
ncbi:hypothetical protein Pelo_19021 [Pelomyxa schiedti]|nr:hypothetical protein Pelo_19021 [Pelomyxa schiedti]